MLARRDLQPPFYNFAGFTIRPSAGACLSHNELTFAEARLAISGIHKISAAYKGQSFRNRYCITRYWQSWEVERFHYILDFAALSGWVMHETSIASGGNFQGGIPMSAIHFLESLMILQTGVQAHRHSTVQSSVLCPCIALGQGTRRCFRRGCIRSGDTSGKHTEYAHLHATFPRSACRRL